MKIKWTCENFLEFSKIHRKQFKKENTNGSKPKKLFKPFGNKSDMDSYIFSSENWNDSDFLREYIVNKCENDGKHHITIKKKVKILFPLSLLKFILHLMKTVNMQRF